MFVFEGSIQHIFNGLAHNPITYIKQIKCATLLLQGKKDKWIDMVEINELFQNLQGQKQLVIFPKVGHQLLATVDKKLW
ncbi:MAG: alpha/beta hydrolase [Microcoleaceae cyanobacterium]